MRHFYLALISLCLFQVATKAQNTVGLISYNATKAYDGYNLIYPHNQPNVYLLNNCGEVVHQWNGPDDTRPGNTAYLLEDGRLVKTMRSANISSDPIWAGGGGATVEIRDWDNNLEWSYTLNDSTARLHHDITIVPKEVGFNIAMIAWERKSLEEVIAAGRDTSVLETDEMWPDYILEIDPITDSIVWEWHAWDHLIQDFDATKDNFGEISKEIGKMNINHDFDGSGNPDWMHSNALDYDPMNDLMMLSVPYCSEIWIIDHSTTTEQAATDLGGLSGQGGDILYRWGNPQIYQRGDSSDHRLFFQHDASFIDDFVELFDPNLGKISVFNNRVGSDFSAANIFNHEFDMYDYTFAYDGEKYGPETAEVTLTHPENPQRVYSTGLSSFQYLKNGNYLITSGRTGYTFEMTPNNEIVWEYITPLRAGNAVLQGDTTLAINNNLTFRVYRYPADYSAFEGRDLTTKGWIELQPNETYCDQLLSTDALLNNYALKVYPNPASDMITIEWENGMYVDIAIYNMQGQEMINPMRVSGGRKYVKTDQWVSGMYLVNINGVEASRFMIQR